MSQLVVRRARRIAGLAILFSLLVTTKARGQDTTIYVSVTDQCARVCDTVRVPIPLYNLASVIGGYRLVFALSRPGLAQFDETYLFDVSGTATDDWDWTLGSLVEGSNTGAQVVGLADVPWVPGGPFGLLPQADRMTLVDIFLHVPCDADTNSGLTVRIDLVIGDFSTPAGISITPVSTASGTLTIVSAALGDIDQSAELDVLDVVAGVDCIFRNACTLCGTRLADVTCDHRIDVTDVVGLINHVFRGAPAPFCP